MPEATIALREEEGDHRWRQWQEQGDILIGGEDDIDPTIVRDEIKRLVAEYDVRQIGYDPWSAFEMAKNLEGDGLTMVEVLQRTSKLNEACVEFEAMVASKRLEHTGHPVMRANIDYAALRVDSAGLKMPVKPKDRRKKIDGVAATMTGLAVALRAPLAQQGFAPFVI